MGNHTVNQEEKRGVKKKEFIDGAAGIEIISSTKAVAIQNNMPHKLQIIDTNSQGINNLPFMIEEGEIINDSNNVVTIKAEDNRAEHIAKRKNAKATPNLNKKEEMTH